MYDFAAGARLSPTTLVPIVHSLLRGLAELHARMQVHGGLKPSNVFIAHRRDRSSEGILSDMGIAARLTRRSSGDGSLLGGAEAFYFTVPWGT